jgi:hypothetical protein
VDRRLKRLKRVIVDSESSRPKVDRTTRVEEEVDTPKCGGGG